MRRVRGVGLALVDARRGLVGRLVAVVRRAGQHHEVRRGARCEYSGSSVWSGMNTVPLPPLLTRSRPWSKNWPNSVNHELYGADRPTSGATFGMKNAPFGASSRDRARRPLPRRRPGCRRLVDDQVADAPRPTSVTGGPAGRRRCVRRLELSGTRRGKPWSAAPNLSGPCRAASSGCCTCRRQCAVPTGACRHLVRRDLVGPGRAWFRRVRRRHRVDVLLRDPDLLQDEPEVGGVQVEPLSDRGAGRFGPGLAGTATSASRPSAPASTPASSPRLGRGWPSFVRLVRPVRPIVDLP